MRATVPRHSWEATGLVTAGTLGAVLVWMRCRWCGQHDTRDRRQRLDPCSGAPRIEPERPRGWWRRVVAARGVALPPEPRPEIGAPRSPGGAWIDSDASGTASAPTRSSAPSSA